MTAATLGPRFVERAPASGAPIVPVTRSWAEYSLPAITGFFQNLSNCVESGRIVEIGCHFGSHLAGLPADIARRYTGADFGYAVEFAKLFSPSSQFYKFKFHAWEIAEIAQRTSEKPAALLIHTRFEIAENEDEFLMAVMKLVEAGWTALAFIDPIDAATENVLPAGYRRRWSEQGFRAWVADHGGTAQLVGRSAGDPRSASANSTCFLLTAPIASDEQALARLAAMLPSDVRSSERRSEVSEVAGGAPASFPGPNDMRVDLTIPAFLSGRLVMRPADLVEQHERLLSDEQVMARIERAKVRRDPFSIVRLGNGEARVAGYPDFTTPIWLSRSFKNWFGSRAAEADVASIRANMLAAVVASDLVGIPAGIGSGNDPHWSFAEVMLRIFSCMPADGQLCRHAFHLTAMKNRFFEELIRSEKVVGLISPHDLGEQICDKFAVGHVDWLPVPGQAKFFKDEKQEPHYPDVFWSHRRNLRVRFPGQIFLIGAGPLGKIYCHWVKASGGIALDIGSVLDVWAGHATRSGFNKLLDDFKLSDDAHDRHEIASPEIASPELAAAAILRPTDEALLETGAVMAPGFHKLRMTNTEASLFRSLVVGVKTYCEFGMGGSTATALEAGVQYCISVESDRAWAAAAVAEPTLAEAAKSGRLMVLYADVGPTKAWGYPADRSAVHRWPSYAASPWPTWKDRKEVPNLTFVDGRFRVACCLAAIRQALEYGCKPEEYAVAIHDVSPAREYYSPIFEFADEVRAAGSLRVLRAKSNVDRASLERALARAGTDPR